MNPIADWIPGLTRKNTSHGKRDSIGEKRFLRKVVFGH